LIEKAPSRLRKRLDQDPIAANQWTWAPSENGWIVQAGEEIVKIASKAADPSRSVNVSSIEQLQCSCLLTPNCFHVLACVSVLLSQESDTVLASESVDSQPDTLDLISLPPEAETSGNHKPTVAVTQDMKLAAEQTLAAVESLLSIGANNAGSLIQAGLLRAGHQCRSVGLYNISQALLRIVEGVQRLRAKDSTANATSLFHDVTFALLGARRIGRDMPMTQQFVGQARRSFEAIDIRRLYGVLAEPILTLSGYAGVSVYMQSLTPRDEACDELFTVNELRPGDSQLVIQAYRGGIDLGNTTQSASHLCRSIVSMQNLTASADGRLGKGKSTRWAVVSGDGETKESESSFASQGRFGRSLSEQIRSVFSNMSLPIEERRNGWDLIAFHATILGPQGSGLLVTVDGATKPWQLIIAIDDPLVPYRENMELLARCPGMGLRCVGRLRTDRVGFCELLAVRSSKGTGEDIEFELPKEWGGHCNLGLDRLQRHFIKGISRWSDEVAMEMSMVESADIAAGQQIQRRLIGLTLGGRSAVSPLASASHRRDLASLRSSFQITGAQLLDTFVASSNPARQSESSSWKANNSVRKKELSDSFLSNCVYLSALRTSLSKHRWLETLSEA